jgi:hypothetical protein
MIHDLGANENFMNTMNGCEVCYGRKVHIALRAASGSAAELQNFYPGLRARELALALGIYAAPHWAFNWIDYKTGE